MTKRNEKDDGRPSLETFIRQKLLGSPLFGPAEVITLFKLELERLQYIFQFPEEVAYQLSAVEYKLFYAIPSLDYIRYVSCDITSDMKHENPSEVHSLVRRFAEVRAPPGDDDVNPVRG